MQTIIEQTHSGNHTTRILTVKKHDDKNDFTFEFWTGPKYKKIHSIEELEQLFHDATKWRELKSNLTLTVPEKG